MDATLKQTIQDAINAFTAEHGRYPARVLIPRERWGAFTEIDESKTIAIAFFCEPYTIPVGDELHTVSTVGIEFMASDNDSIQVNDDPPPEWIRFEGAGIP